MKHLIKLAGVALLSSLLLAACGGPQQWSTKNITGVMPDLKFTLTNEKGRTVHAGTYQGKVKLLYFGYTHCPDICPITLGTIGRALKKLGPKAKAVRVLFVSVDPKRDDPATLKKYTAAFGPKFVGLTGTQQELHKLVKRYRVSYSYQKPDKNGDYTVNHSAAIFVFDRDGKIRLLMNRTNGAKAMAHDLNQLVEAGS